MSARTSRPQHVFGIGIVGFGGDGRLEIRNLKEMVQSGHDTSVVVDPRPGLHRTLARTKADFDGDQRISVLGISRLDLADASVFQTLLAALEDRWAENWLGMPHVEF
jgi:hypothetical protein